MDKKIYDAPWFVYIVECRDETLYVGVARDVKRRISDHNGTSKCRYTRARKPLELRYKEKCQNYSIARKREAEIKKISRKKKLDLINNG